MDIEQLADQWIQAWADGNIPAVGPGGDTELDWELPKNQPEKCLKVILNVLEKIPSDPKEGLFGILGAGPFEMLIDLHGDSLLNELKQLHEANPKFRKLFNGVSYRGINPELDRLHRIVLFWVSGDYEQVSTIIENVSSDYKQPVSADEIWKALIRLSSMKLVDAFFFDNANNEFVAVSDTELSKPEEIWWLISKKGKELLNDE